MKEASEKRSRVRGVRLNEAEFTELSRQFSIATDRDISSFIRRKLLDRPVRIFTRDASLDALTEQLAGLRQELSTVASRYKQAVTKLQTLDQKADVQQWLIIHELDRRKLLSEIERITGSISQLSEKWLQ